MQIKSHIADDLRRRADDPDQLAVALDKQPATVTKMRMLVDEDPSELNVSHLGRELSRWADHLLLADRPAEALAHKEEAADIWRRLGRDKAAFLADLDTAEITFELGRPDDALAELDALVARSADEPYTVYRDFALELRARCLARLGRDEAAMADMQQALSLRQERGNAGQIAETERLLQLLG